MATRASAISAVTLLAAIAWAWAAAPAAAQREATCDIAFFTDEALLDWESATSPSRALEVPHDALVVITGHLDPSAPIEVTVDALGGSWTLFEGPTSDGAVLLDIGDYARYGVGLYRLDVSGGCSATAWVEITGRSPFTTPAGLIAALFALVGAALVIWAVIGGNGWRGAFGGLVLGLGLTVLLQQLGVLPLTVVPLMTISGVAALAGGAGGAVAQRTGPSVPGTEASPPPAPSAPPSPAPAPAPASTAPPPSAPTPSAPTPSAPQASPPQQVDDAATVGTDAVPDGGGDEVLLGASAPRRVEAGREATLRFLAYREDLASEVERRVTDRSPTAATVLGLASCRWEVGTPVVVTVSAKGLDIARPSERFEWNGSFHILEFDAEAPAGSTAGTVVVKYDVAIDGIVVARLRHDLEVDAPRGAPHHASTAAPAEQAVMGVRPARTAFASYASEDRAQVLDRVSAIRTFARVDVWLDTLSLHPGDHWEQTVADEIRNRDVFLLFWSARAATSRWVEWEWRAALRDKHEDALQVQPLDPVAVAPPPPELSHLHFGDVLVDLRATLPPSERAEEPDDPPI